MTEYLKNARSLYIDGQWVPTPADAVEAVINPATEDEIALAPVGGVQEAEAALAAARTAFDKGVWPRMSPRERSTMLQRFIDALKRREAEIKNLIVAEAGSTRALVDGLQFGIAMRHAQHCVNICERNPVTPLSPVLTPNAMGTTTLGSSIMVRAPIGVVAAITAYNFPLFLNLGKVIPALAVGCTVVLKPSPYTPLEALFLGEIAEEIGLPPGVLNVITGGIDVGEMLTTDKRVDLVSFTGSDRVGAMIQAQAAPTLKRLLLELGGKSALIVRPDANIAAAAAAGMSGFTLHGGQGCSLLTRHLVHNSVRADYVAALKELVGKIKVGNPSDTSTTMGPLIRDVARRRAEDYVQIGLDGGGKLVAGGSRPAGLDKGFYFEPTFFDNVENSSRIAQEEIFGPIGVVIGYDTDEEAIAMANDSDFGLGGGIFSADTGAAYEMALQIRTGNVALNGGAGTMNSAAPFGGIKRSGYGVEHGLEGLNEFTYIKSISFRAA